MAITSFNNTSFSFLRFTRTFSLILIFLLLAACANEASMSQRADAERVDLIGYERVVLSRGGVLYYKKLSDATFGYDSIHVADVGIGYAKHSSVLSAQEKSQVQSMLRNSLSKQVERFGSLVTEQPDACSATEHVYLKDLDLYKSNVGGSQSTIVNSLGAVTVVSEFRDSTTGELIFKYEERRGLGGGRRSSDSVDILRLSQTLTSVIDEMAPKVYSALPRGGANSRAHLGCSGLVGKRMNEIAKL